MLSYQPYKRSVIRKYDGGWILQADASSVSKSKSMVLEGQSWRWSRSVARSRDYAWYFWNQKQVKLSWPKTSREWKKFESISTIPYCLKRISEYREFEPKKILWKGNFMERFSWFVWFSFLYRNLIIHAATVIIRIDHSQVKNERIIQVLPLEKVVFPKDINHSGQMN